MCEPCGGRGYYYQGYGIGTQKCRNCDGDGYHPYPNEWRPYEQNSENEFLSMLSRVYED